MKKLVYLLILSLCVGFVSGCAFNNDRRDGYSTAIYGSEQQYESGDFWGVAGSGEIAQIKRDKLALKKLENSDVQSGYKNGAAQGYKGVVVNFDKYDRYNFIITGPERKSYMLGPGETETDYLIPGTYSCSVYEDGDKQGDPWIFHVTAQQHSFKGKKYHWYVYMK